MAAHSKIASAPANGILNDGILNSFLTLRPILLVINALWRVE